MTINDILMIAIGSQYLILPLGAFAALILRVEIDKDYPELSEEEQDEVWWKHILCGWFIITFLITLIVYLLAYIYHRG